MTALRYHRFDTPLGRCGIAWTDVGVARLQLPEADDRRAVSSLERRGAVDAEPPPEIAAVCRDAARHLGGQPADFSAVALPVRPARSARRWGPIRFRSSCRATAWSGRDAASAASPRPGAR